MEVEFVAADSDFNSTTRRFYFFAYSLDMDEDYVKVYNPHAKVNTVACLRNYRLVFKRVSQRWQGALASIDTRDGDIVWGVVWENDDVILRGHTHEGPKVLAFVEVETIRGRRIVCRTTQIVDSHAQDENSDTTELSQNVHLPSRTYIMYMSQAAKKAHLPVPYISELETLQTNRRVVLNWETGKNRGEDFTPRRTKPK